MLTFDYVGALAASLLFPLHPDALSRHDPDRLHVRYRQCRASRWHCCSSLPRGDRACALEKIASVLVLILLGAGFAASERLQRWAEVAAYQEPVIYAESSRFQRIVLTRSNDDLRLYLNGNLQFSSRDEYRYHEALVHPALGRVAAPAQRPDPRRRRRPRRARGAPSSRRRAGSRWSTSTPR